MFGRSYSRGAGERSVGPPEPKGCQVPTAVPKPSSPSPLAVESGEGGHKPSTPLKLRGGAEGLRAGLEYPGSYGKLKGD